MKVKFKKFRETAVMPTADISLNVFQENLINRIVELSINDTIKRCNRTPNLYSISHSVLNSAGKRCEKHIKSIEDVVNYCTSVKSQGVKGEYVTADGERYLWRIIETNGLSDPLESALFNVYYAQWDEVIKNLTDYKKKYYEKM